MRERFEQGAVGLARFGAAVVLILVFCFLLFLTACAFLETGDISTNNPAGELVELYADNIFLNALVLFIVIVTFYLLYMHSTNFSLWRTELVLMLVVFVLGVSFILSVKLAAPWYSDSYLVLYAAEKAAIGEYAALDNYFCRFPFQLGYVLYVEIVFRLMGSLLPGMPAGYYRLALQGVNVLWLLVSYHALIQISWHLFQSRRVQKLSAVLLIFCLPPVFTCTFLYGNIPGFALGTVALWMFSAFMGQRRLWQGLLCALSLGMAVTVKLNLLIFFVAIVIVWLLDLLQNRGFKSVLCLALTVASVLAFSRAPQEIYERRSGKDFGSGIPMLAWMAMGVSEGHAGPGWYKEDHTVDFFMESGMDPEATAENAKKVITERLAYFAENPGQGLRFFSEKLRSQWNEPTYESLWINQVQQSYGQKGFLYDWFCASGEGNTTRFMNQYQQFIFLGSLLSCLFLWIRRDIRQCLPSLIILGGLLYHLLFEAKSQYALPYFILMVPLAAYGFCSLFKHAERNTS